MPPYARKRMRAIAGAHAAKRTKRVYARVPRPIRRSTSNLMGPLSRNIHARLIYEEQLGLTSGLFTNYRFSANGVYDPNITGSGHQPRGFDQLMALYDHCTVIGSKITCHFTNTSATVTGVVSILVSDNTLSFVTPSDVLEYRNVVYSPIMIQGSGAEMVCLTNQVNPSKFLSISNPLSEDTLKNSASANAAEDVIYHINLWNQAGVSHPPTEVLVRIEYECVFTEPKQPGQS